MRTIALALVLAACSSSHPENKTLSGDEARKVLLDRNWLDRMPQTDRDRLHVYRFVPSMGGGVFQDRTIFFGTFELFAYEQDGQRIRFNLLHTGEKKTSTFAIEALDKPGPEGVDLKLTISDDPRGSKTYYGWRKETQDLDGQLAHLFDSLRH